jgi:hypothetical protein
MPRPLYLDDDVHDDRPTAEEIAGEVELREQAQQQPLDAHTVQRQLKALLGDQVTIIAPLRLRMRRNH